MAQSDDQSVNRARMTCLVFALLAALVAYKTINTNAFENSAAVQHLALADRLAASPQNAAAEQDTSQLSGGPGYPLVVSWLATIDTKLKAGIACHDQYLTCDSNAFTSLFAVQFVLAMASLVAIFLTAWIVSKSWSVALLTVLLGFIAGTYGAVAGQLNPVIWSQSLMLLFLASIACAVTRDNLGWTLAAGASLGLASLFMPQLFLVGLVTALCFPIVGPHHRLSLKQPLVHSAVLIAAMVAVVALAAMTADQEIFWSATQAKIAAGLEARQRLSALAGWDHLSLLLSPIPIVGSIFQWLFGLHSPEHIAELAMQTPATHDPAHHLIATPAIFLRGLWAGTPILTILGLLHIKPLLKFSKEDLHLGPTLFVAIPICALVIINTCVTENRPDLSVGLVFLLVYATAYLVGRTDIRRRYWADKSTMEDSPQPA